MSIVGILNDDADPLVSVMKVDKAPLESYADVGGLESQIQEIKEAVELPLTQPELYEEIGIRPPKGVILYGEPGTGKTLLAKVSSVLCCVFVVLGVLCVWSCLECHASAVLRVSCGSACSYHREVVCVSVCLRFHSFNRPNHNCCLALCVSNLSVAPYVDQLSVALSVYASIFSLARSYSLTHSLVLTHSPTS